MTPHTPETPRERPSEQPVESLSAEIVKERVQYDLAEQKTELMAATSAPGGPTVADVRAEDAAVRSALATTAAYAVADIEQEMQASEPPSSMAA